MQAGKLSFGLWYSLQNPAQWAEPAVDKYSAALKQIEWAETIGFDDVWLAEHHVLGDDHLASLLPMAAAIAARTKRIRIGTGILILPLYDAVRIAEDAAFVDIISNGRFELGVGIGYNPKEFDAFGQSLKNRRDRMNEGLEVIRALWSGEPVNYDGKHYQLDNLRLDPLPVQRPRPPIWVGGMSPVSAKRAARLGDGFIGTREITDLVHIYREECDLLGKTPRVAGGSFWLVVSKTPEKTFAELAPHVMYQLNLFNGILRKSGQLLLEDVPDVATLKAQGILQVVSPQEAVDAIATYVETTGCERWYSWTVPPGYPTEKMNEHLELMAKEVMPHFR